MYFPLKPIVFSGLLYVALAVPGYGQVLRQPAAQPPATGAAGQNQAGAANDNPLGLGPNTPTVKIPIVTPGAAVATGDAQVAGGPPFPALTEVEQKYLDDVLMVWEKKTEGVKQFQCDFKRWQYDPTKHPTAPFTIARGVIKYSKPDKGMMRVDELVSVANGNDAEPQYRQDPRNPNGEYWICDGSWVHQLDRNEKKAVRSQLPPEMRGNQIHLSPLPFLFGVKAAEIKQRYYVRTIRPPAGNDDVWIEAWPKRSDDAGNYSRVQIVISRTDTLPSTMIVFLPNWTNVDKHREVYEFENRKTMDKLLDRVQQLVNPNEFISTKLPSDWQVIEEPWVEPQGPNGTGQEPDLRTATPGNPPVQR